MDKNEENIMLLHCDHNKKCSHERKYLFVPMEQEMPKPLCAQLVPIWVNTGMKY